MKNILSYTLFCCLLTQVQAGNFVLHAAESELAADMHASPSHDFTSVAREYSCDIQINPATMEITTAVCRFKFENLDSGKASRDKKMCRWIDTGQFPEAQYTMKALQPTETAGHYIATGTFKMAGIELPLELNVRVERKNQQIVISGQTEIDHRKWGLKPVRLLFFSVDPTLKPRFKLVGHLAPEKTDV